MLAVDFRIINTYFIKISREYCMTDHDSYFQYLRGRSKLGLIYRQFWLYPRLCKNLTGHVLDVGCGIGDLVKYRADTVGVDINPKTVEWCKSKKLDVHFMEKNQLPFDDHTFDSAVLDNVLEHLEAPEPLLAEIHRILIKDGIFIVGVPGKCGYSRDPDHKIFYSKNKLTETVSKFGFRVKKIFAMPIELRWLELRMAQFCFYGVFQRV
jgi:SAM-dependent methyltransferase